MKIIATDRTGNTQVLDSEGASIVMEVLRDKGMGVAGDCDGSCSCATCHVYLTGGWYEKLSPPSDEEIAALDTATAVEANSRLSCQIRCIPENDGITLSVAPGY